MLREREEEETCSNCGRVYRYELYDFRTGDFVSLYDYQCCYKCLVELIKWAFDHAHADGVWKTKEKK